MVVYKLRTLQLQRKNQLFKLSTNLHEGHTFRAAILKDE